jgi:zinc protease
MRKAIGVVFRVAGRVGQVSMPLLCAGVLASGIATPARARTAAVDSTATLVTLDNGLKLLLAPDPAATAVNVAAWVDAGVRYERAGAVGISHLVEHITSGGGSAGGADSDRRRIEAEGGSSAAYTAADYTCYSHTVPRAAIETVFRLEAARLAVQPSPAMLEAARTSVREENRARRANPIERSLQALTATAFTRHPYRWPVPGSDSDLERITLDECRAFLRSRYTPDHVLITVVGDFDPTQVQALARRTFGALRTHGEKGAPGDEPERSSPRRATVTSDFGLRLVTAGWTLPPETVDAPALDLIAALLSQGPLSRLNQSLVSSEGGCRLVQAGRDGRRDASVFWALAALEPEADSAAVENRMIDAIESLARTSVGEDELDRARRSLEISLLLGRETVRDCGQALGIAQLVDGDWHAANRRLERLRSLTAADLQKAARELTAARRTVVWLRPPATEGRP